MCFVFFREKHRQKKATLTRHLECFHNGIILIVNCLKICTAKVRKYFGFAALLFRKICIFAKLLSIKQKSV